MMIFHELKELDFEHRRNFADQFLLLLTEENYNLLMMTDKAHFHLSGSVNKQNFRYWSPENPRLLHQQPLHIVRVMVWCGIACFGVIGPYFFEDEAASVTSERYIERIRGFFVRYLNCGEDEFILILFGSNRMGPDLIRHEQQ